jgi:hypothetical protein
MDDERQQHAGGAAGTRLFRHESLVYEARFKRSMTAAKTPCKRRESAVEAVDAQSERRQSPIKSP